MQEKRLIAELRQPPAALTNELLRESHRAATDGHATKFRVIVDMEPLNDTTIQSAPEQ